MTCDRSVVFSGYSGFSTNRTDRYDIAEILLKVALNTITLTKLMTGDHLLSHFGTNSFSLGPYFNFTDISIRQTYPGNYWSKFIFTNVYRTKITNKV